GRRDLRPDLRPGALAVARSRNGVLPGFGLTLGFAVLYLSLLVLVPLSALFLRTASLSAADFLSAVASPRALAPYPLRLGASLSPGLANAGFGLVLAWVLTRYRFPGRGLVDALVDLPFALPTAVAGITLTTLLAKNGWLGRLLEPLGVRAAYTPLGVAIALTFIGLPFVVRSLQPVLEDLESEAEEAAASLGAGRLQTFPRVLFPALWPALVPGSALAFARSLGEYGSVVFISGNMPLRTEIVPLLIVTKLEQYDYAGATAVATVMLVVSFVLLFVVNGLQPRVRRCGGPLRPACCVF